ncbi:MAG: efflux RND transporter permease subunit [Pseudomonadota bacterium]
METLFVSRKRLTALLILVVLSAGLSSLLSIGRQEDPTITNLFATVVTSYPGAEPTRVEALVTEPIEEELREIAEIVTIESASRVGVSLVTVELSSTISDETIEQTWSEIRDALSDAAQSFPAGAQEPTFDNDRTGAVTAISALVPRHDGVPLSIVNRYSEDLQDRLRKLSGTKIVERYGASEEEVVVEIDPGMVASLGLTPERVADAIRQADSKVSAGRLRGTQSDLLIEVEGEITNLDRLLEIPVITSAGGAITRIGDIATVRKTERQPEQSIAYANGKRAVLIAAKMENDLQVDTWMARVKAELQAFEETLPAGLEHRLVFDQNTYTVKRLSEVGLNMLTGITLVIIVLFFTLGARAAMIVATVLPLVSLASIATLNFLGLSIHQMSVTGLIVALGLLVDAAIVMTDEIRKRLAEGEDRISAAGASIKRLAAPLAASTVTTALSFMPMALLPGPAGDFVGAIAIAVIVMLIWSFVIAMTVTPAIAGWWLPETKDDEKPRFWKTGLRAGPVGRLFAYSLKLSMANPRLAVLYAMILPIIGFLSFPTLTAQFFPGVDRDQFYIEVELPSGTAISRTDAIAQKINARLTGDDRIRDIQWVIGESAPAFYYNMVSNRDQSPNYAQALITTRSDDATAELIAPLQRALDAEFPMARILVRDLVQGPPVDAPLELRFVGPDIETLRRLGDEARLLMDALDETTHVRTSIPGGAPKLEFILDEDKVDVAGLDMAEVARQLETALEGVTGGSLIEGTEELPVRVRVGSGYRADAAFIQSFDVISGLDADDPLAYRGIPLSALGEMRLVPAQGTVNRRDGERTNTVQGFVQYGVLPEEALVKMQASLEENGFIVPPGYRMETGGDADERGETLTNLMSSVGLIVTLTIAAIILTFNSFRLSLVTLCVAVLSAGLSLLALAIMQYPFGIQAVIGVIGSIGVSINAAIIIMTALQADARAMAGDRERITEIVMGASRHIVSTTVTTFGGFLPLILEGGGFWPPFAVSIAGGVLLSTVVSFYFTPPMFLLTYAGRKKDDEDIAQNDLEEKVTVAAPAKLTPRIRPHLAEAAE